MMNIPKNIFSKQDINSFNEPLIKAIGDEWLLLTAGDKSKFNVMTASWGGLGVFWHKPVAICFIRPTRHTFELTKSSPIITYSFFTDEYKSILKFCGANSGSKVDKIKETGLLPVELDCGGISYQQSRLCIETKTLYFDDLKPKNFPEGIDEKIYPNKDYHRMFIGEILGIYKSK